jgi:hypothetical protein
MVYFIRPDPGFRGVADKPVTISLGGTEILSLAKGQYTLLFLNPGYAEMKVASLTVVAPSNTISSVSTTTQLTFAPGATQYLEFELVYRGPFTGSEFVPREVSRDRALRLAGELSPIGMAVREPIALSPVGMAVRDPTADHVSTTALHEAAKSGNTTTVAGLLSSNPRSIAARDGFGGTALHVAAASGQKDVAELLLAKGAVVNDSTNSLGVTPLHLAAGNDHKEIAALLLANGADVHARNKFGQTPLMVADCQGRTAVASLLREHLSKTQNTASAPDATQDAVLRAAAIVAIGLGLAAPKATGPGLAPPKCR